MAGFEIVGRGSTVRETLAVAVLKFAEVGFASEAPRLRFMPLAEGVDGRAIRVDEVDAGAVARTAVQLVRGAHFERSRARPGERRCLGDGEPPTWSRSCSSRVGRREATDRFARRRRARCRLWVIGRCWDAAVAFNCVAFSRAVDDVGGAPR